MIDVLFRHSFRISNLPSGSTIHEHRVNKSKCVALAVDRCSNLVATAHSDGRVHVTDFFSGQVYASISEHSGTVLDMAFTQGKILSFTHSFNRWMLVHII